MVNKHPEKWHPLRASFFEMDDMVRHPSPLQVQHWLRQNRVEKNDFHNLDRQRMIGQSACLSPERKIIFVRFLIDNRTNVQYNLSIATLGKMLNSNSNNRCMVSLAFPLAGLLIKEALDDAEEIRNWLARIYY